MIDVAVVERAIDALDRWGSASDVVQLVPCRRCGADVDSPCRRPNGEVYPGAHSERWRRAHPLRFSRLALDYRADLREGQSPGAVLAKMHSDKLYRRLVELGKLDAPIMKVG